MDKILITGGAGYIGSYANKFLAEIGYQTIVLDNLEHGSKKNVIAGEFIQGDLQNRELVKQILKKHGVSAVFHFAAFIDVGESTKYPLKYYENNVSGTIALLQAMQESGVHKIIFSSSAAVYGMPNDKLISENSFKSPINPYGKSKWMCEQILEDLAGSTPLKYTSFRYFNAAGGDPEGKIHVLQKNRHNLIPKALQSLRNNEEVCIFGIDYPTKDGTCIRDYVHVHDLAKAHLLALERLNEGGNSTAYNLGSGLGFSVREVLEAVQKVTGKKLIIKEDKRRDGDPPCLVADFQKARKELGFEPVYGELEKMIEHSF